MPLSWWTPSHTIMLVLLLLFAIAHSGLAALRPWGETKIGARGYRILFALVSLPLAVATIGYFLLHRYDGALLWQLQGIPWIAPLVWVLTAISFVFLYPATFNLLEIAAIAQPQVRLYETGITRITRHPQTFGQILWCIAHSLWLGTSFMMVASAGLIAHHLFSIWHGDRRLRKRYGEAFEELKSRTSIIPFLAIAQGKQTLVWKEFVRPAYLGVAIAIGLFWFAHRWIPQATAALAEIGW
ncbi:NnrU family protein [Synechococcus elongatus]|uniref:NnrU family protein n=1 Tax=Synechococcus elongatus PCC 11801 TaxID=2219813 RepID=A0AAN1QNC7_SYNEL|nr:NnrU family protein [Synechococcus elongatus]AZB72568.1 hypothetical protein DOP62_07425 [Synechococcus elongatus PCC 11801]